MAKKKSLPIHERWTDEMDVTLIGGPDADPEISVGDSDPSSKFVDVGDFYIAIDADEITEPNEN